MTLAWVYAGAFVILWILGLVHCLRNSKLYRLFGFPTPLVKTLWILFFLTFSPIVLVEYLILGIFVKANDQRRILPHLAYTLLFLVGVVVSIPPLPFDREQPIRIARTPNGWQESKPVDSIENPQSERFDWKRRIPSFHLGVIESRNSLQNTSTVSAGSHCTLAMRRIAIVLDSKHLLLSEIAQYLHSALKEIPEVKSIEMWPSGFNPTSGGLLPDLWIHLELSQISEIRIPPTLRLNAEVNMTISNEPFHCNHSYRETRSLPFIEYMSNSNLSHHSKTVSIGSSDTKYALVTPEIGKELVKTFRDFLNKNITQYGIASNEFERLIPERIDSIDPPLEILRKNQPMFQGYCPLLTNIAYWKIPVEGDLVETFTHLMDELKQAGWVEHIRFVKNETPYFRYAKEEDRITAFIQPDRDLDSNSLEKPKTYIVKFERRMNPIQVKPILQQIASTDGSTDFLLTTNDWFWQDDELRQEYLQALERQSDPRPEVLMQKSYLYQTIQEFGKQWHVLHEALAAEQWIGSESIQKSTIENEIAQFKKDHSDLASEISWKEIYESLGAEELVSQKEMTIERIVQAHEPVGVFHIDEKGQIRTISAMMVYNSSDQTDANYHLNIRIQNENGGSATGCGGNSIPNQPNRYRWDCQLNDNRFFCMASSETGEENMFSIRLTIRNQADQ